jgi:hypothetical protein
LIHLFVTTDDIYYMNIHFQSFYIKELLLFSFILVKISFDTYNYREPVVLQIGDIIEYFYPEGCAAEAENCFKGEVIKVTDGEGIYVEPSDNCGFHIMDGCCHHLEMTHNITTEFMTKLNPVVRDYKRVVGEVKGKIKELKRKREERAKCVIDEAFKATEKASEGTGLNSLLQNPTHKNN